MRIQTTYQVQALIPEWLMVPTVFESQRCARREKLGEVVSVKAIVVTIYWKPTRNPCIVARRLMRLCSHSCLLLNGRNSFGDDVSRCNPTGLELNDGPHKQSTTDQGEHDIGSILRCGLRSIRWRWQRPELLRNPRLCMMR